MSPKDATCGIRDSLGGDIGAHQLLRCPGDLSQQREPSAGAPSPYLHRFPPKDPGMAWTGPGIRHGHGGETPGRRPCISSRARNFRSLDREKTGSLRNDSNCESERDGGAQPRASPSDRSRAQGVAVGGRYPLPPLLIVGRERFRQGAGSGAGDPSLARARRPVHRPALCGPGTEKLSKSEAVRATEKADFFVFTGAYRQERSGKRSSTA